MGWTSYVADYYKNGKIDRKRECDAYFLEGLNRGYYEVVKSTMVGSVYYAAVKPLKKRINGKIVNIPTNEQEVYAMVILTQTKKIEFYYKEMSEDMGPGYYDCPESILNLLSPTDTENALAWRENCRKQAKSKKLLSSCPTGTIIRFTLGDDKEKVLIKQPPMYRFKTEWWQCLGKDSYYKKGHIPMDYETFLPINCPVVGLIYNWKGLSETNYLYTLEDIKQKDVALYNALMNYSGNEQPTADGCAVAANKTSVGILLRNRRELKEFLEFKWNDVDYHKEKDENWYCSLSSKDYYGTAETSKIMERAIIELGINPENMRTN